MIICSQVLVLLFDMLNGGHIRMLKYIKMGRYGVTLSVNITKADRSIVLVTWCAVFGDSVFQNVEQLLTKFEWHRVQSFFHLHLNNSVFISTVQTYFVSTCEMELRSRLRSF